MIRRRRRKNREHKQQDQEQAATARQERHAAAAPVLLASLREHLDPLDGLLPDGHPRRQRFDRAMSAIESLKGAPHA